MARPDQPVHTCPDCGGILQVTVPEALTSAEVQSDGDRAADDSPRQCLICGYQEAPEPHGAAL